MTQEVQQIITFLTQACELKDATIKELQDKVTKLEQEAKQTKEYSQVREVPN